ncbi:unnamed protein product [Fraxinus pennsylvanica]|uniref:Isopenicillin N synthase-like Fe(2+) 2OG dioxygenase domain-containing protein n=1 Tax=Fraxinus pennsylvanica TaxID=56036 RepID=A0AAD1Z3Y3_9LAMI|nr:unnamed protein product [Fraxinus pennsylvanica]
MGDYAVAVQKLAVDIMGAITESLGLCPTYLTTKLDDGMQFLSNGRYKSVVHGETLNNEKTRISIASLHSLGMDVKMETAKELVDEEHPKGYKESSFNDFLDFISKNNLEEEKSFLKTLKIQQ